MGFIGLGFLLFLLPLLFLTLLVFLYLKKRKTKKRDLFQKTVASTNEKQDYQIIDNDSFVKERERIKRNFPLENILHELKVRGYQGVGFVHGTFVGDDPLHFTQLIEESFPSLSSELLSELKKFGKKVSDIFLGDFGNFSRMHPDFILDHSHSMKTFNLTWSSANNHYARLVAAIKLIKKIDQDFFEGEGVILLGHSHAGQVFALVTQIINNKNFRLYCEKIFKESYKTYIKKLSSIRLCFITLGTPWRYEWELSENMKLLHFINHRGDLPLGGSVAGALFTKSGDYIQQWGITGSDIAPHAPEIKKINEQLDLWLGDSCNREVFKQNFLEQRRLHSKGHHYLIDFGDGSFYPNILLSGFGHGIYTKLDYVEYYLTKVLDLEL